MIINELYQVTSPRHTFRYNQVPIMERKSKNWRLLRHPPAGGAWNMAVDEALLESVAKGASLPILRLYAWEPACLSLGQAQPAADVDRERLAGHGWELVRRPTGGRAILHTDELTYAVIAPVDEPHVRGTLLESYLAISHALVKALEILGLEVAARDDPQASQAARSRNPVCFEEPSSYEILFAGKKIIGSAQARRGNTFLQHGALPLTGDLTRITHALAFEDEVARQRAAATLLARATTVEAALGRQSSWGKAADAFATGFSQALGLVFQEIDLSTDESRRAETIMREKFAGAAWTLRI
ncbi:MAG: biotin/lipoate A/B protein ligase family protein [Anaerolineaceae bacterium]